MQKIKVKETSWGAVHVPLVFGVGRTHCRDRRLDDTCQTEEKMVNENDLGRSDCRNSFYNRKSIGSTSMERSTTVFELYSNAKEVNMHAIVKHFKANMSHMVLSR